MSLLHPPDGRVAEPIGPGRLILVVGPSGAGKDTLIQHIRTALADNPRFVFPTRVVTRDATSAEDNGSLSPERFRDARTSGAFAVDWEAHGLHYGLPRTIIDAIRMNRTVVANVSRTVIDFTRQRFANTVVVLVTAPPAILADRLAKRARISDGPFEARLGRTVDCLSPDFTIQNLGAAEAHAAELMRIVAG